MAVLGALGELRERGVPEVAVDVSEAGDVRGGAQPPPGRPDPGISPDLVTGLGADAAAETLVKALVRVGKDLGIPAAGGLDRVALGARPLAYVGCTLALGPFVAAPAPSAGLPWPGRGAGPSRRDGGGAGAKGGDRRSARAGGGNGRWPRPGR